MKKKLSVLILSCFLLSTPCFAFDGPHPHKKHHMPKPHKIVERPPMHQNNNYYYYVGSENIENLAIITESVSNIVDVLFN